MQPMSTFAPSTNLLSEGSTNHPTKVSNTIQDKKNEISSRTFLIPESHPHTTSLTRKLDKQTTTKADVECFLNCLGGGRGYLKYTNSYILFLNKEILSKFTKHQTFHRMLKHFYHTPASAKMVRYLHFCSFILCW